MKNKPRIRFKGFAEDWEQRKFSDITYLSGIKNKENKPYESYSISNEFGFIPQDEQFENGGTMKTADKSMYYIVSKNSFAYNPARINVGSIGYYDKPDNVIVSSLYEVFKTTDIVNDKFLWHWFKSNQFNRLIEKYQEGGVRLYFYYDKLCKGTIELPAIKEQNKISNLLDDLDIYITLHQRKLEKLKLVKKALLQKLFPKNGSQFPEIRFKGFTDTWEQRKLGDIATFSKGNGYSKSDLASSGDPIILYGRLYTNYETTISNVDTFVELKDKSIISQGGEVIVPASGETAEDISRASVVKNQGIIIGGDLNVIKANHLLDPTFLALTISNGEQQKELSKRAQGKSVVHLHNSDLQEVNLTFPLLNEQKEISTLFEKMDNIITLHQRKLEKLKLVKKALLQKLFPKNGSQFPEIRFKGFTDTWEQRKLTYIFNDFIVPMRDKPKVFSGTTPWTRIEDIEGRYINTSLSGRFVSDETIKSMNLKVIPKGSLIVSASATFGVVAIVNNDLITNQTFIGLVPNKDFDIDFLYSLFEAPTTKNKLLKLSAGSTIFYIARESFENLVLSVPSKVEQIKISKIFKSIDNSITLHQRKLDKLQDVKKGLLQKMFV